MADHVFGAEKFTGIVGVVGAGTMGAGIAQGAAAHGLTVRLYDRDAAAVARALAQVAQSFAKAAAKGKMSEAEAAAAQARLKPAATAAELADCALVVEAIIENADAKRGLFVELSRLVPAPAVLATNTSSFRVGDLAEGIAAPERFVGLHYFFPAAINPLVEVVRGPASSEGAIATATAFATACRKHPITCADAHGFAVNRFFVPYINEAARLLDDGFTAGEIDAAARAAFQTAVGPFWVMDVTKPEIGLHATRTLAGLGDFYAPAPALVRVGEARGLFGPDDAATVTPGRAAAIVARLQAAVLLAVLQELEEGVASPADLDDGARLGLAWGWLPCAAARAMGHAAVAALVRPLAERWGAAMPRITL